MELPNLMPELFSMALSFKKRLNIAGVSRVSVNHGSIIVTAADRGHDGINRRCTPKGEYTSLFDFFFF